MTTDGGGSVTRAVGGVRAGDRESVRLLWDRYFADLVRLARARLREAPRGPADEEDVALSAFHSFCRGAEDGHYPCLGDRESLWRLLVKITTRKAANAVRDERRQKRGGGRVRTEASLAGRALEADGVLDRAPGREPTPEMAALVAEEYQRLFGALPDPSLRLVALLKLEGYTDQEVARIMDCGLSTVERRLRAIRKVWSEGGIP
jgi:DNA-directed RNA polymerase specialized sigma24 family protein